MSVTISGTAGVTFNDASSQNTAATGFGFKNRLINGSMVIDQRNAGASISVAGATPSTYFPVDRFFCQASSAAITAQRVAGSGSFKNAIRLTGAASNTNAYTSQRIESLNTYDLVSQNVTLSAVLSRSSGTACTWTAYYATASDNFTSVTSIATGTFTLSSTATTYSATFNAGANAGNGIMIEFAWGALTAGVTVDITGVQLEKGSTATSFDYRPYGTELQLAQRYYFKILAGFQYGSIAPIGTAQSTTNSYNTTMFPVPMRTRPTALETTGTATDYGLGFGITATTCNLIPTFNISTTQYSASVNGYVASGLTLGNAVYMYSNTANGYLGWSAEL
jgi:hypothetical protein